MPHADARTAPSRAQQARDWGLALLLTLAFKAFYSAAATSQLQWLLWPLATLLNNFGHFAFAPTASGEWLDAGHGLVIVKACAGGNFLVASWLGYLWLWRERPFGATVWLGAFAAAWLTTLAANALRILAIAHGQDGLASLTGLSAADSHRLIGICVYFGFLSLQLAGRESALAAPGIYLGVALVVPVLHAWVLGRNGISADHAAWTAGVPLAFVLVYCIARLKERWHLRIARRGLPDRLKDVHQWPHL